MCHPARMERNFDPVATPYYIEWLRLLVTEGVVSENHVFIQLLQAFVMILVSAHVQWSNLSSLRLWCISLRALCTEKVYRFLRGAVGYQMGRTSEQSLHILKVHHVTRM